MAADSRTAEPPVRTTVPVAWGPVLAVVGYEPDGVA